MNRTLTLCAVISLAAQSVAAQTAGAAAAGAKDGTASACEAQAARPGRAGRPPQPAKAVAATAQSADSSARREVGLDEIVVMEQRADALPAMTRTLTAVGRAAVERAPAPTLNDLLRTLPAVDLRQRGPLGAQADLSVRGGTFDQTQVLLNGVNFSDPQTGHYSLDIPIDLSSVSRLEILQGLSAPGAVGGALNVATGDQPAGSGSVLLVGGQHGYLNAGGNAATGSGRWYSFIAASYRQSEGYTANTDFRTTNLYGLARLRSRVGDWEAQAGLQDKPAGANGFYSFTYPDQFDYTRTLLGSIRWQREINKCKLSAAVYHRTHFDRFELFRGEAPAWYAGPNYHRTQVDGAQADMTLRSVAGVTTVSAELRNERIMSTVLGTPMASPKPVPFEGDARYTHSTSRMLLRAFVSQGYQHRDFGTNAGVSFHHSSDFGDKFCFAGDVRYRVAPFAVLYAAANQSLRLPTFTDLYYTSPTHEANPALKPEQAVVYEAGGRMAKGVWAASSSIFYRRGRNIIDWVYTEGTTTSKSLNYSRVNAAGAAVSCQWNPGARNPRSFIQYISVSYTFTHTDKASAPHTTSYALDYLKHKLNLALEYRLFVNQLKASWNVAWYDRAGTYVDAAGATQNFDPFVLADFRLRWDERSYSLYLEANNLFSATYFDYGGLLQPKRWLTAGLLLRF